MNVGTMRLLRCCRLMACCMPLWLSACAAPDGLADGAPFDLDQVSAERARITTRVKAALVADERVAAASIQVILDSGGEQREGEQDRSGQAGSEVLRLEGFVGDTSERDAALDVARSASQGLDVIDGLQIR